MSNVFAVFHPEKLHNFPAAWVFKEEILKSNESVESGDVELELRKAVLSFEKILESDPKILTLRQKN